MDVLTFDETIQDQPPSYEEVVQTPNPKRKKRKTTKKPKKDDKVVHKKREERKTATETIKKVAPRIPRPIFAEDQKERVMYCRKRLMFCNNPDKRLSYHNHIEKLMSRPVITFA